MSVIVWAQPDAALPQREGAPRGGRVFHMLSRGLRMKICELHARFQVSHGAAHDGSASDDRDGSVEGDRSRAADVVALDTRSIYGLCHGAS